MDQCSDDTIINLCREIDIIAQLNHPALLKFIGFCPTNLKNHPNKCQIKRSTLSTRLAKKVILLILLLNADHFCKQVQSF